MMLYEPKQRQRDKRWDMTSTSGSGHTCAIGYCNIHNAVYDPTNHLQYHDTGHNSADDALACFNRWRADNQARALEKPDEQRRCAVCAIWTTHRVQVEEMTLVLCADHATRDNIVQAITNKTRGAR